MSRFEATPTAGLLVWARETAGLSLETAAQKAKVKLGQLSSWERGVAKPSMAQLRKLAILYKRPLAAFYLPKAPERPEAIEDFRRLSTSAQPPSSKLSYEIRRAHDRREWALEMIADIDEMAPIFKARASIGDSVEQAAEGLRRALRVTITEQTKTRSDGEAFRWWRTVLENAGILTLQATSVRLEEARGFSISVEPLPVAVVNIKDAPRGRIFTLLHEATHIMLNAGGICDLHDDGTEAFCNQVAGAALFPRDAFLSSAVVRNHRRGPSWADSELAELSREFGGSREAALVRLLTLKLTTQAFYNRMHREFVKRYQELRERRRGLEGHAPPHVVAISSAGPLFTGLVLESLGRENITASDVSDYLQIRLKHLKELQNQFAKGA